MPTPAVTVLQVTLRPPYAARWSARARGQPGSSSGGSPGASSWRLSVGPVSELLPPAPLGRGPAKLRQALWHGFGLLVTALLHALVAGLFADRSGLLWRTALVAGRCRPLPRRRSRGGMVHCVRVQPAPAPRRGAPMRGESPQGTKRHGAPSEGLREVKDSYGVPKLCIQEIIRIIHRPQNEACYHNSQDEDGGHEGTNAVAPHQTRRATAAPHQDNREADPADQQGLGEAGAKSHGAPAPRASASAGSVALIREHIGNCSPLAGIGNAKPPEQQEHYRACAEEQEPGDAECPAEAAPSCASSPTEHEAGMQQDTEQRSRDAQGGCGIL
mmetsp:Transcript_66166/g.183198  ORF Transcript_66166/g.183198 Transcript_66166/m.183198 type:complete len:329 (-) Transcript_66166:40-1026(-)